jgi:hypothetical protein
LTDKELKAIAACFYLQNVTHLDFFKCKKITDEGIKAIATSLQNLTNLNLSNCYRLTDAALKYLAESALKLRTLNFPNIKNYEALKMLIKNGCNVVDEQRAESNEQMKNFLIITREGVKNDPNFNLEDFVTERLFHIAPHDDDGSQIKYIIKNYPFRINAKNRYGRGYESFYMDNPEIQHLLFNNGKVPFHHEEIDGSLKKMAHDKQSVHADTKRRDFFINLLMPSSQLSSDELKQKAEEYKEKILPNLFSDMNPLVITLLDGIINEKEKRSVMEGVLGKHDSVPDDKEFIKIIRYQALDKLKKVFLAKNSSGEYTFAGSIVYNSANNPREADKKHLTTAESIGLVANLINTLPLPPKDVQELCATLFEREQGLVKDKLSQIKEILRAPDLTLDNFTKKSDIHTLLNNATEEEITQLFNQVGGLDINNVWQEQQGFKLAKQIYVAANTYPWRQEHPEACIAGTIGQIITTATEIDVTLLNQFTQFTEEEKNETKMLFPKRKEKT